jgi:hypothetical protein
LAGIAGHECLGDSDFDDRSSWFYHDIGIAHYHIGTYKHDWSIEGHGSKQCVHQRNFPFFFRLSYRKRDVMGECHSTDAFIFACIPVIYFYVSLYFKANQKEKPAIGALLSIFLISMFFWAVFKQNGTALTRWANYYTDRSVPASVEKPLEDIYMVDNNAPIAGFSF